MQFLIPFGEKISEWLLPLVWVGNCFYRIPFTEILFENGDRIISINLPETYFLEVWNGVNFVGMELYKNNTVTFSENAVDLVRLAGNNS